MKKEYISPKIEIFDYEPKYLLVGSGKIKNLQIAPRDTQEELPFYDDDEGGDEVL